jgi:hypothetical protein
VRAARARFSLVHHDTHASQNQKHAMVGALHAQPPNSTHGGPRREKQSEQHGHHTTSAMGCVTECPVVSQCTAPSDQRHAIKPLCSAKLHVVLERSAQKNLAAHTRMRVSQRASRCQEPCGDSSDCPTDITACVRLRAEHRENGGGGGRWSCTQSNCRGRKQHQTVHATSSSQLKLTRHDVACARLSSTNAHHNASASCKRVWTVWPCRSRRSPTTARPQKARAWTFTKVESFETDIPPGGRL